MKDTSKVRKFISRGALAGASLAACADGAIAEELSLNTGIVVEHASEIDTTVFAMAADSSSEAVATEMKLVVKQSPLGGWDETSQNRFMALARKYSLAELTENEAEELEMLQRAREIKSAPRSFEEIESDYEMERLVAQAIEVLDQIINRAAKRF